MTPTQLGLLLLGVGAMIPIIKGLYDLFHRPAAEVKDSLGDKEKDFMTQLHEVQLQNLEYQKEIIEQLSKLNGVLSVQDTKVMALQESLKEQKSEIKELYSRVSKLEAK